MNPLPFGLVLSIFAGSHDVNVPGDLRLAQARQIVPYVSGSLAPIPGWPWLALYAESDVFLSGNVNSPWPHAPSESGWGLGVKIDRAWWFLDATHESTHHVPGAPVFATRGWSGLSVGAKWGPLNLTSPHVPPGY